MKTDKSIFYRVRKLVLFLPLWVLACSTPTPIVPTDLSSKAKEGTVTVNTVPSPWTVAEKYEEYQGEALSGLPTGEDVGGNEGLVHLTISANVAFAEMAKAYDRVSYTPFNSSTGNGRIEDSNGNVWVIYQPSSIPQFQAKGYNVKKSIDWSTVTTPRTYTYRKLRFTKD